MRLIFQLLLLFPSILIGQNNQTMKYSESLKEALKKTKEISKLKSLTTLNLWYNHIESFPTSILELSNLTVLKIGKNKFTHIPKSISKLKKLKTLYLYENPIPQEKIEQLIKLLPNCSIT
jgi:Leucine-rich repeat (LRR) protein